MGVAPRASLSGASRIPRPRRPWTGVRATKSARSTDDPTRQIDPNRPFGRFRNSALRYSTSFIPRLGFVASERFPQPGGRVASGEMSTASSYLVALDVRGAREVRARRRRDENPALPVSREDADPGHLRSVSACRDSAQGEWRSSGCPWKVSRAGRHWQECSALAVCRLSRRRRRCRPRSFISRIATSGRPSIGFGRCASVTSATTMWWSPCSTTLVTLHSTAARAASRIGAPFAALWIAWPDNLSPSSLAEFEET